MLTTQFNLSGLSNAGRRILLLLDAGEMGGDVVLIGEVPISDSVKYISFSTSDKPFFPHKRMIKKRIQNG